jgi:hypothetical protein
MPNNVSNSISDELKQIVLKVTVHKSNKKEAFGIDKVKQLWFQMCNKQLEN